MRTFSIDPCAILGVSWGERVALAVVHILERDRSFATAQVKLCGGPDETHA